MPLHLALYERIIVDKPNAHNETVDSQCYSRQVQCIHDKCIFEQRTEERLQAAHVYQPLARRRLPRGREVERLQRAGARQALLLQDDAHQLHACGEITVQLATRMCCTVPCDMAAGQWDALEQQAGLSIPNEQTLSLN